MDQIIVATHEFITAHYIQWIVAIVGSCVGYFFIKVADKYLGRFFDTVEFDRTLEILIQRTVKVFLWVVLVIIIASNLGFNVNGLVAGLGVTGFVVGFATKDVLGNLAAGLFILIKRPFKVGDSVKVSTIEGEIGEINLASCIVYDKEGTTITVPNSKIWGNPIYNKSRKKNG
jgi:small conductance mechanosensitive channel